jgi:hypothetical protein
MKELRYFYLDENRGNGSISDSSVHVLQEKLLRASNDFTQFMCRRRWRARAGGARRLSSVDRKIFEEREARILIETARGLLDRSALVDAWNRF